MLFVHTHYLVGEKMNINNIVGLGIAGNFAGHLEQAGENEEFSNIHTNHGSPAGLFPFYLQKSSRLNTLPYSSSLQRITDGKDYQVEPEVALLCNLTYENGLVVSVQPTHFTVCNDCTIRSDGSIKISDRKNWGSNSKGISNNWLEVDNFSKVGNLQNYSIASFVERDNQLHKYGLTSEVKSYSCFNEALLKWIVSSMNNQIDEGPLENISDILKTEEYPSKVVILLGATPYEKFGQENYLKSNDIVYVIIFNHKKYSEINVEEFIDADEFPSDLLYVKQTVTI